MIWFSAAVPQLFLNKGSHFWLLHGERLGEPRRDLRPATAFHLG
jgi:hypothetical protein